VRSEAFGSFWMLLKVTAGFRNKENIPAILGRVMDITAEMSESIDAIKLFMDIAKQLKEAGEQEGADAP